MLYNHKFSQCLHAAVTGVLHLHMMIKSWPFVATLIIVVRKKGQTHHIKIPLSGHGSGRFRFLVQGGQDWDASAAGEGARALEQTHFRDAHYLAPLHAHNWIWYRAIMSEPLPHRYFKVKIPQRMQVYLLKNK